MSRTSHAIATRRPLPTMPQLVTTADPASLREVMSFVARACADLGVSGSAAFDVRLAVEEICTNIIRHGYGGLEPGPLVVDIEPAPDALVVRIEDRGVPFDPDDAPPPDLTSEAEERPIGGVGVHLVRQVMDEVEYSTGSGGNTLRLVKRLDPQG